MNNNSLTDLIQKIKVFFLLLFKDRLPVRKKGDILTNLKQNWYFPISATAFFILTMDNTLGYCIGLPIAFGIMMIVASQISSMWSYIQASTIVEKIGCLCCAVGICIENQANFYRRTLRIIQRLGLPELLDKLFLYASYIGAACALFFVFFCVLFFCKKLKKIESGIGLTDGVNWKEWAVYVLLLIITLSFMVFSFAQSQAFYGTELPYDIIYTSDSPDLVKENAYLVPTHTENDLRQPLFAIFAAPFLGIPYLVAQLTGASASVRAMLVNSVQIVLLFSANFMLARLMKLDPLKRICFMLLTSCTYTQMLFSLMMEQYVVVYFWLVFCMLLICEKDIPDRVALWGAGGTLLTSMILLPFMSNKSPIKNFKAWLLDMVKFGLEFVVFLLACCRFDVLFNAVTHIKQFGSFTGKTVTLTAKIYQYTDFITNCFVAPNAGTNTTTFAHISWQQNTITGVNWIGVLILALAVISAIWNRKKKSSILAVVWIGLSAILMLGLGWGTKENGLILYALYFGWALVVLLFQLIEKFESKLKVRFLSPTLTVCSAVMLLVINIPKIMEMVYFAIANYPV